MSNSANSRSDTDRLRSEIMRLSRRCPGNFRQRFSPFYLPCNWERTLFGLIIGFLWGNALRKRLPRLVVASAPQRAGQRHLEHHASVGTPEEAEHVGLAGLRCTSPCSSPPTELWDSHRLGWQLATLEVEGGNEKRCPRSDAEV